APDGRDRDRRIRRPRPPDDGGHAGARPRELNPRVRDRRGRRVGAVASPPVDVLVLGPLEVRRDGEPVTVRRGRPRRLLISLLLRRGGAVSPATLIDQLWGDDQPVNADNALQLLVSSLTRTASTLSASSGSSGPRRRPATRESGPGSPPTPSRCGAGRPWRRRPRTSSPSATSSAWRSCG